METVVDIPKYNLNEEEEKKEILRHYRLCCECLKTKLKPGDKELLRTAFEMAADAHKTMRRKSGEPYIFHPLGCCHDLCGRNRPGCTQYHLCLIA